MNARRKTRNSTLSLTLQFTHGAQDTQDMKAGSSNTSISVKKFGVVHTTKCAIHGLQFEQTCQTLLVAKIFRTGHTMSYRIRNSVQPNHVNVSKNPVVTIRTTAVTVDTRGKAGISPIMSTSQHCGRRKIHRQNHHHHQDHHHHQHHHCPFS